MIWIITWLICGFICSVIAGAKGRSASMYFLTGLILGPLGIVLCAVIPANVAQVERDAVQLGNLRKCPFCAELVKTEAIVCKHCSRDLEPVTIKSPSFKTCQRCGETYSATLERCNYCGA